MLVFSRKKSEVVLIGRYPDQIAITITKAKGRVGVGIDAPKNVPIVRAELDKQWPLDQKRKQEADHGK